MDIVFALLLAFGIGIATAAQSPTNGSLGTVVGPIQASMVSMAGGFVILSVLCFFVGTGDFSRALTVPPWMLTGGLFASYIVFVMALCTRNLGVALSVTLIMLGQLLGGIVIDTWGLMESKPVEVSALRIAGSICVLAGICLVYLDRLREQKIEEAIREGSDQPRKGKSSGLAFQTVLVFSAGVSSAFQAPVNTGLSAAVGTFEASVISFAGGLLVLLVLTLVTNKGRLNSFKGVRPWQLTGGIYGAFGVPSLILATPVLGVGLVMGGSMVGQILGGIIVDTLGLFGVQRRKVNLLRIIGAVVLLGGVLLVSVGTA